MEGGGGAASLVSEPRHSEGLVPRGRGWGISSDT